MSGSQFLERVLVSELEAVLEAALEGLLAILLENALVPEMKLLLAIV